MGAVFAGGMTIVIFAGSERFTGTALYLPRAALRGEPGIGGMELVRVVCWIGNLIGTVVLAAILHAAGGDLSLMRSGFTTGQVAIVDGGMLLV